MLGSQLPAGRRNQSVVLAGQVNPGLLPESSRLRIFGDGVDVELATHVVEVSIAGVHDRTVQVQRAMLLVALEKMSVESGSSTAVDGKVLVDRSDRKSV